MLSRYHHKTGLARWILTERWAVNPLLAKLLGLIDARLGHPRTGVVLRIEPSSTHRRSSVEASLAGMLGSASRFAEILARCVLTPACGLGMRGAIDAERIFEQLREAQRKLRKRLKEERASETAQA